MKKTWRSHYLRKIGAMPVRLLRQEWMKQFNRIRYRTDNAINRDALWRFKQVAHLRKMYDRSPV